MFRDAQGTHYLTTDVMTNPDSEVPLRCCPSPT